MMIKKVFFLFIIPMLSFGQFNLAEVDTLYHQKQYLKAEKLVLDYLKSSPEDLAAIELLGDAYGFQKKWDQAIEAYEKLVKANPNNANYQYKYGGVLGMQALAVSKMRALPFINDAKKAFLKAAELDAKHIDVRWALVQLYMQLPGIIGGSKSKALNSANELENLSKVDGYLAKGYIYEYDDESELAEKYYKLAITEGGSLTCFNKLSNFYEKKKQPEKAIKTIEEAQKHHNFNVLHYQIGKIAAEYNIHLEKGETSLQTYLEKYTSKDVVPKAWAHYRLAQIYQYKNNKHQALNYIDMAIAQLPETKPFIEQRQQILNL
jgi:tetratricopeptide (TPR) repeat protein